ncbi:hypothetical protein DMA11_19505 [Marinilabiliaceae bacterium JC017]|nr:hypothetical protein DMA11_19505 [Marinilabiliaceae bacterium JC017]
MEYTALHWKLKECFTGDPEAVTQMGEGVSLYRLSFQSSGDPASAMLTASNTVPGFLNDDDAIQKNNQFYYYVLKAEGKPDAKRCIVLLHGLNERSWDKYLPWGHTLVRKTGCPVILFPIAYHMNRSPEFWRNPRKMMPFVLKRQDKLPDVQKLSVANVALSERMTMQPQRFFLSGYQAAYDLLQLIGDISAGKHPFFPTAPQVDFFSYSIGAFLTQVMMLANPNGCFNKSKFFFFCGGSVFFDMHGISRYILDSTAFERLLHYYKNEMEQDAKTNCKIGQILNDTLLGQSFKAMLSMKGLKKYSTRLFADFQDRLKVVTLTQDTVIIPEKVKQVLSGVDVEEENYDFGCSHEVPFPICSNNLVNQVNGAFERLFTKAATFFTSPC